MLYLIIEWIQRHYYIYEEYFGGKLIMKTFLHQGDVIYLDFNESVSNEISGIRPAVVISSNKYNRTNEYIMVVPVTNHGNNFNSYVELKGYRKVHGRVNTAQVHCYSIDRVRSTPMDQLRVKDFNEILSKVNEITAMGA